MPIFNSENIKDAPDWVDISSFGIGIMKKENILELHYHDCDEYWFIISGKALIRTEGETFTVQKGDLVCTKMGEKHEVVQVLEEDFITLWIETRLKGQKRPGHLHD